MENEQQQLQLIAEMISSTKKDFSDSSSIYLIWGWSVFLASLAEYVLIRMGNDNHGIVWAIFIPLALVAQIIFSIRQKKTEKVRSYLDKVLGYVWTAIGISMFVVLSSMGVMQKSCYPALIVLYGIGTFISGGVMKLKIMQAGAICCWVIAMVSFYVPFEYQLLLLSLSLLLSYIIPGHVLKSRIRKNV
jgi:hypothetical protein